MPLLDFTLSLALGELGNGGLNGIATVHDFTLIQYHHSIRGV